MESAELVWYGISGGALVFACTLLYQRYVRKDPRAVQSRGSFAMFAGLMVMFAIGAALAGVASGS